MGRIVIRGDEEVMVEELSKYVSRDGARVFVRSLLALNNVIGDDEKIEGLPGFEDDSVNEENLLKQHNGAFNGINNKNYKYSLNYRVKSTKSISEKAYRILVE